ncbi:MAG TPA: methyltransferase domain-containing protein [Vicinamibacterales bacterium]|jgi:ubiquinone/menaquinone biosynthesis C-methylase UbiE|nr:methyltransferase domain-containing protein [Vicinamibacterales bacterium]
MKDPIYVCGHTPGELERLRLQSVFFEDITRRMFEASGLQPGFRVLDIGCGVGDVSFLAAEMVGPSGFVVGIDRAPEAVGMARARAQAEGRTNVEFHLGAIDELVGGAAFGDDRGFDALVGRFVLMHQSNPAATLRAAAQHVRPGGVVVFLESAMSACVASLHSFPHSPTYDRIVRLITDTIRAAGGDVSMGLRLAAVFEDAGLPHPTMRLQGCVESGRDAAIYRYMTDSLRSVLPLARQLGVDDAANVNIEKLEEELRAEVVVSGATLVSPPIVAAWCKINCRA